MRLKSLYLQSFRNFTNTSIDFGPKLNVFFGPNAQGKTNLLEAIGLISTGRSFRTARLSELIQDGAASFLLEGQIESDGIEQTIRISFDGKEKRIECNHSKYPSFQSLLGLLPSIFFTPQDLDLVSGSPASRRRFLNLHLAQSDPLYFHHYLRYWRAMKQRNALLRQQSSDIRCWEQEMAPSAAYLFKKRSDLIAALNVKLASQSQILANEAAELMFLPSQPKEEPLVESYLSHLEKTRLRDKLLGLTMSGPHRDDFSAKLDQKTARQYASDGQKRTLIAALRLAEWRHMNEQIGASPLFCVDDLEMHLDAERQKLFYQALLDLGQVFLTTTDPAAGSGTAVCHRIVNGCVS